MSDSEKIQRYIIKSTPYGELPDVLKDLDKVSPIDLSSSGLQAAVEEYNDDHMAIVTHPYVHSRSLRANSSP